MSESSSSSYPIPPQPPHFNKPHSDIIYPNIIRIPNIHHYNQEIVDGNLILKPLQTYIVDNELKIVQFTNSSTVECTIKEHESYQQSSTSSKTISRTIILDIWKSPESKLSINVH